VFSSSFFTTAVQHRALREGSELAAQLGYIPTLNTYKTQAANVLCFLQVLEILSIQFSAWSHSTVRPIGIRQENTSRPTREEVGPGRTQILSSRRSTPGTLKRDVMRLPSSRARTRHYRTLRFMLTPSAPFTPSTRVSALRLPSQLGVIQKTHTSMEMYASSCLPQAPPSADAAV
jgi:hypothetical protein